MQNSSRQVKFFYDFKISRSSCRSSEPSSHASTTRSCTIYKIGTYVLVRYEGELWPGQITKVEQDRVQMKCFQKAAAQGSICRWPDKPDEKFYQIGYVEQEMETPLDTRSSSSSLRSSNLLVRVAELDYLYRQIYFMFTVNNFFSISFAIGFLSCTMRALLKVSYNDVSYKVYFKKSFRHVKEEVVTL